MKAFISYSHQDEQYLNRFKVHLAQMKRENLIDEWTDAKIYAGESLDQAIYNELESSDLFIALVSPDYIASNYCYNVEFRKAQELQGIGRLLIVPVIVEACDWKNTPFAQLKALPKDGKPVNEWLHVNLAFQSIIEGLRHLILSKNDSKNVEFFTGNQTTKSNINFKIKKSFSEVDRFNFKENSFKDIFNYFQTALEEWNSLEELQGRFTTSGNDFFTCLISNRANNQNSFITIKVNLGENFQIGDLTYSYQENFNPNSYNPHNIFYLKDDEYELFWSQNNNNFGQQSRYEKYLDAKQVAEFIWKELIERVGVSMEY